MRRSVGRSGHRRKQARARVVAPFAETHQLASHARLRLRPVAMRVLIEPYCVSHS